MTRDRITPRAVAPGMRYRLVTGAFVRVLRLNAESAICVRETQQGEAIKDGDATYAARFLQRHCVAVFDDELPEAEPEAVGADAGRGGR